MQVTDAWEEWWRGLGHVARCNRDMARTREAFDAGYAAGRLTHRRAADGAAEIARGTRPGAQRHETWRATRAAREST
jgi:hypothetical protein